MKRLPPFELLLCFDESELILLSRRLACALLPLLLSAMAIVMAMVTIMASSAPAHGAPATSPAKKILHVTQLSIHPGPLDPAQLNSIFGANIIENIMEPMLQYDYLARPLKLVPLTLREMPEIQEEGRVYICRLKPGILFADDPAFNGKPRELIAKDYAYSFQRMFDPKLVSTQFFMVDGKIAGANGLRDLASQSGRFDVDSPIKGLRVLDRYTLRIELTEPDLNFLHVLAQQNLSAIAREVVERHGAEISTHPVGTGPFRLKAWQAGSVMTLERNANFREEIYPAYGGDDPISKQIAAQFAHRRIPMVDEIDLKFSTDSQPTWLSFLSGDTDVLNNIPVFFRPSAIPGGKLAPGLVKQGIRVQHYDFPSVWSFTFNMRDPIVGGSKPAQVALRRAIGLAIDNRAAIDIAMYGGGVLANGLVPPGVPGHDANFRPDSNMLDLARARALLDTYGYIDRDGDGWREDPAGKPLVIEVLTQSEPRFVPWDELYARAFASIGIRTVFSKEHGQERYKRMLLGKYQTGLDTWNMDFPDGEDFYVIVWGKTIGLTNTAQFINAEFDVLFEQSRKLLDSPERSALYRKMDRILFTQMPLIPHLFLRRSAVTQPWLLGYVPHPVHSEPWKYLDIDMATRPALR